MAEERERRWVPVGRRRGADQDYALHRIDPTHDDWPNSLPWDGPGTRPPRPGVVTEADRVEIVTEAPEVENKAQAAPTGPVTAPRTRKPRTGR